MKLIIPFFFLVFSMTAEAFAKQCKVYGISDSPQKMRCSFKGLDLNLSCQNGDYYLNASRVSLAYHMEVEEGPVPLVFKSPDMQLTTLIHSKRHIRAELEKSSTILFGRCR